MERNGHRGDWRWTLPAWGYRLRAVDGGTELAEDGRFLPTGYAVFGQRYGARAAAEIAERADAARRGIPQTLAALKRVIEAG